MVYGGFSQTPWVRVPQLPVFRFSPFSQQAEFHLAFVTTPYIYANMFTIDPGDSIIVGGASKNAYGLLYIIQLPTACSEPVIAVRHGSLSNQK